MNAASRYPEIDMIRGIAILMMILFHTIFDLSFFGVSAIDVSTGFWKYFAFSTAALFLLVVGISLTLSHARASTSLSGYRLARKFLYRGAGIFLLGLLVTAGTWLYLKEGFIVFGILHLIGISVMISPLFFRFKMFNVIPGLFFIMIGFFLTTVTGPIWLLPLGIHPATFWSVDYEPVFPWTGIVLLGMGLGEYLYRVAYGNIRSLVFRHFLSGPLRPWEGIRSLYTWFTSRSSYSCLRSFLELL